MDKVHFIAAVPPVEEAFETYIAIAKYATHAETWAIVQTDHEKGEAALAIIDGEPTRNKYLLTMGFQDRDGYWWIIWHSFQHKNASADEWLAKDIQERIEMGYRTENVYWAYL